MPTVMSMHWPEVTEEQYEAARKEVNWEGQQPEGARLHVAWFAADGFHVFDLWDSPQDFQKFVDTRLRPGVEKIGIQGQPKVEIYESHAVYAPNV
jgi:hypothetical protein